MLEGNKEQPKNRTIDERIDALTVNLKLAERQREAWEAKVRKLDARERKARQALLAGLTSYKAALKESDGENGSEGSEK